MSKKSWKRLFRLAAVLAALLSVAYYLLPWYLPTELIRKQLVEQLHQQWDCPVDIAAVSTDWVDGIQLTDLTVFDPHAKPPVALIRIEHIQTPLSPWQLYRGRMADLSLENIQCRLAVHDDGSTSFDQLIEKMMQPRKDTLHISRIHIDRADILITAPSQEVLTCSIGVCDLEQLTGGKGFSWLTQMSISQMAQSKIVCRGSIRMNDSGRLNTDLSDQIRLSLTGLDLTAPAVLPLANVFLELANKDRQSPLPRLSRLAGLCSINSDITMLANRDFKLNTTFNVDHATLQGVDRQLPWLSNAHAAVQLQTTIDPVSGAADVTSLKLDGSGLQIDATAKYDPENNNDKTIALSIRNGQFRPVELYRAVPAIGKSDFMIQAAAQNAGTVRFDGNYSDGPRRQNAQLHINADDWGLTMVGIYKQPGDPLSLSLKSRLDHDTGLLSVKTFDLKWLSLHADASFTAGGFADAADPSQQQPNVDLVSLFLNHPEQFAGQCQLDIGNFDDVLYVCEHILDLAPGLKLTGPVRASVEIAPGPTDKNLHAQFVLPPSAQCSIENLQQPPGRFLFVKPTGQPVELEMAGTLKPDKSILDKLNARCSVADSDMQFDNAAFDWSASQTGIPDWNLTGNLEWRHLETFLAAFADAADQLKSRGAAVAGNGSGHLAIASDPNTFSLQTNLDLTQTAVKFTRQSHEDNGPLFNKPQDRPAQGTVNLSYDRQSDHILCKSTLDLDHVNTTVQADITPAILTPIWPTRLDVQLTCDKLDQLGELLPDTFRKNEFVLGDYRISNLAGPAQLQLHADVNSSLAAFNWQMIADNTTFAVQSTTDDQQVWNKRSDSPCRIEGQLNLDNLSVITQKQNMLPSAPLDIHLPALKIQLSDSTANINGTVQWQPDPENPLPVFHLQDYPAADLNISLDLAYDDDFVRQIPQLNRRRQHFGLSGRTRFDTAVHWSAAQKAWSCSGTLDLKPTGILIANPALAGQAASMGISKPAGDPVRIRFDTTGTEDLSDINIKKIDLEMDENHISASAVVKGFHWPAAAQSQPPSLQAAISITADMPKLDQPAKWIKLASPPEITGRFSAAAELNWQNAPSPQVQVNALKLNTNIDVSAGDVPFHFAVKDLDFASHQLNIPAFEARCGQNDITLVSQITFRRLHDDDLSKTPIRPTGRIDLWSNRLDIDSLQTLAQSLETPEASPAPAADWNYKTFLPLLRKFDLEGSANIASLSYTDPKTKARLTLEQLKNTWKLDADAFKADFLAGLNGGVTNGAILADLTDPAVPIHYTLTSKKLRADENLRPLVESEFPGMEVTGFISEQNDLDSTLQCLLSGSCYWKGNGTSICEQGTLFGPGGPGWILKVFPGLKLVEYSFKSMTNKWQRFDDGRKNNHMVFKGDTYDIYLDGDSVPLRDPTQYDTIMQQLKTDLDNANQQVAELDDGKSKLSEALARQVRKRAKDLAELWQRHQTGQTLHITEIDYNVGGLLSTAHKDLFTKPTELLRVPIFRSRGYIIGQSMIGLKTTNVPLPGMK